MTLEGKTEPRAVEFDSLIEVIDIDVDEYANHGFSLTTSGSAAAPRRGLPKPPVR